MQKEGEGLSEQPARGTSVWQTLADKRRCSSCERERARVPRVSISDPVARSEI